MTNTDGTAERITRDELRYLIWLDAADRIEKSSRLPDIVSLPETLAHWLPGNAVLPIGTTAQH